MMKTLSRRNLLRLGGGLLVCGSSLTAYAGLVEPNYRLEITRYRIHPQRWTPGLKLKIAALADIHAGEGPVTPDHLAYIVERTNHLNADMIVLLGDYLTGDYTRPGNMPASAIAHELSRLRAPLGTYAVLGNHDWWNDEKALKKRCGPTEMGRTLEKSGIPVLKNEALKLVKDGFAFWLTGLDSQWSFFDLKNGAGDLPKTLGQITDDAPAIMLAHEPDIFPEITDRIALTMCGHTHGGQVRLFGYSPIVPSRYGNRYAYGHIMEDNKHLIVSGGVGSAGGSLYVANRSLGRRLGRWGHKKFYVRLGVPPEIVLVDVEQ